MKLTRLPLFAGIALLTASLWACVPPPPQPNQPAAPATTAPPAEPQPVENWADSLGATPAPENWRVYPCENPVLLCVEANGELIGTVERFSYPVSEVTLPTPIDPTEDPQAFLQAWAADFYTTIEQDRQLADSSLTFTSETPEPIAIAGSPGLKYGYTATHPNGALFDRSVGYVTLKGNQLYVFTTGVISGDPTGAFADVAALEQFEPYLDEIIQDLSL